MHTSCFLMESIFEVIMEISQSVFHNYKVMLRRMIHKYTHSHPGDGFGTDVGLD